MKLRDHLKPQGHYKPAFNLVEPRIQIGVKYDADEFKD